MIRMIVAMDAQRVIGANGKLPWYLPSDMAKFREHTVGKTVVMGRKTYESIGHALPDRHNFVLSRSSDTLPGAEVLPTIASVLQMAATKDVWIIGGGQIYKEFLPYAEELYVTAVAGNYMAGTVFFPEFEQDWQLVEAMPAPRDAEVAYEFRRYILKKQG